MNVLTRGYNNARTMANTTETVLVASNVKPYGVKKIFSLPFEGDARGCEAAPLIVSGVKFPDGRTHNISLSATMANQIYCHDADTSQLLWEVTLDNPIDGSTKIDSYLINDHWGILSTPVIDTDTMTLYCVTWSVTSKSNADGGSSNDGGIFMVHAVALQTGAESSTPLSLEGATYTAAGKTTTFKSVMRKQRASLLLTDVAGTKTIFIGCGSMAETASTSQGWIIAIDIASWKIAATFATTVTGSGAGVWQAGAGLVADANGFIYCMTGNGDFDAVTNWGEAFLKLQYTAMKLEVVDWFAPYLDDERNGKNVSDDAATPSIDAPDATNARPLQLAAQAVGAAAMSMGDWGDQDLGSGGPVLDETHGILFGAGKDGVLYAVNVENMGKTQPADLTEANSAKNYAKLSFPPIFFTYYQPGNPAPNAIADLNVLYGNVTHHQHGEMILWESATHGWMLFCWGENGNLRAWSITGSSIQYLACSAEVASVDCAGITGGGMPGGMISLSSNGANDGIVWASIPYGNANTTITPGRLLAYDAQNFGTYADGSKQLVPIWDSQDWNIQYLHNKFNRPVVANGKLYLPTYNGRTDVYQLAKELA
jgi:hypothetical protein